MSEDNNRGNRGEVGHGSPGSRLKALWHAKKCPGTLKQFVRSLKDNPDVALWKANKSGKNNTPRSADTIRRAKEVGQATKQARRKKSDKGGK
jgi:hypothetical protein